MTRGTAAGAAFEDALVAYAEGPSRRSFLRLLLGATGIALAGGAGIAAGRAPGAAGRAPGAAGGAPATASAPELAVFPEDDPDCLVQFPMVIGQPCPGKRHHEGHTPTTNGCGPADNAFLAWAIPDGFGLADFAPACDAHDVCYGTCNNDKHQCDSDMVDRAIEACETAHAGESLKTWRLSCITVAKGYGEAVDKKGDDAFAEAQAEDCECVHCKSPDPIYCGYLDACFSTLSVCMDQCKSGMGSFGGYLCGPAPEGKCGK